MTFPFYDYDSDFFSTEDLLFLAGASGKAVEDTATGNPLTFLTDLAKPLKSLLIPFTPQQEGTGDPSPSNIRSILPWNKLSVVQNGENQLNISNITSNTFKQGIQFDVMKDSSNKVRAFHIYGQADINNVFQNLNYVSLETLSFEAGEYEVGGFGIGDGIALRVYSRDANNADVLLYNSEIGNTSFTVPSDYKSCWMRIQITTQDDVDAILYPVVVKKGDCITDTDIVFPSAVYGGKLDVVSGVLTVELARVKISDLDWQYQANWNGRFRAGLAGKDGVDASVTANLMCDCYKSELGTNSNDNIVCGYGKGIGGLIYIKDSRFGEDAKAFVEEMGEHYICYPIVEPQTVTLTPTQITALIGNNTIWSDADGSMTAVYLKKG